MAVSAIGADFNGTIGQRGVKQGNAELSGVMQNGASDAGNAASDGLGLGARAINTVLKTGREGYNKPGGKVGAPSRPATNPPPAGAGTVVDHKAE